MIDGCRLGALILMGGEGKRFGSLIPKQFEKLAGRPVYQHTLEVFLKSGYFDEIVLSCHPEWIPKIIKQGMPPYVCAISAGMTRQQSSFYGLTAFSKRNPPPSFIVIHDAVRPFISCEILKRNIEEVLLHGAVNTCIPCEDTLVYASSPPLIDSVLQQRDFYWRGQTPQSFSYPLILEAHRKTAQTNATDDCQLALEQGHSIRIVLGEKRNMKITSKTDLLLAERLLGS